MGSTDIVFDYTVTGTATEGADYTDTANGQLIFTASDGATDDSSTITLVVQSDEVQEVGETMVVTLTDVTTDAGTVTIGSPNAVTTTIREDIRTLSIEAPSDDPAEGSAAANAQFAVSLSGESEALIVRYDVVPGTATDADYTAPNGILTLSGTDGTGTITVPTTDDNLAEDDETYSVRLSPAGLPDDVALGFASATATIPANDDLAVTVTGQQDTVVEGSNAVFTVMLMTGTPASPAAGSEDVVVTYMVAGGTGTNLDPVEEDDFEAPDDTLTIPAGETMGILTVATLTDDLLEPNETLRVTLTDADTGAGSIAGLGSDDTTVADSDGTVLVSISDTTTMEGDPARFTVSLSGKVSAEVAVEFTTEDGTAEGGDPGTAGSDYTPYTNTSPGSVRIPAGETTGTITVVTARTDPDMQAEDSEVFTVMLGEVTVPGLENRVQVSTERATGRIDDNDPLTASLTGLKQVREGSQATYTVTLSGGTGSTPVEVAFTVGGTATPDVDYTPPTETTLTIPEGTGAASMSIGLTIDTLADQEVGETLVVRLTDVNTEAGSVSRGAKHEVVTTVLGEDAVIISVADVTLEEDETDGSADFEVAVSGELAETVRLSYATAEGTATSADYTAKSDTLIIPTIADPPGAYTTTISVAVENDSLAEKPENFTLSLSLVNPPDGVSLAMSTAIATIIDDEELMLSVASEAGSVVEGSDANFPVTLDGGTSTADVVVKYTVAGGGADPAEPEDYRATGSTLTLPAGTDTATITIPIGTDDVLENAETLVVTLTEDNTSPTTAAGSVGIATGSAMTNIVDPPGTVTVSVAGTTVTEGSKALFPVTLSGKVSENVTVTYSVAGSGADPATTTGNLADLTSAATSLVIEAGETSDTITVSTNEDNLAENSETFTVTLTDATGVSLGAAQATGTIRDNERLLVTLEGPDRVAQGGNADGYQVRLTGGEGSVPITVKYTIDGEAQTDISITSGTVASIPAITTGTDPRLEGHTLVVRLTEVSTAAGEVSLGSTREKRTEIVHQDTVTVSIAAATATVEEDVAAGTATFNVTSTGSPSGTVTVRYQTVAGSARSPADFTAGSGTATVGVPITVPIVDDTIAEGAETFSVRLTGQPVSTVDTDRVVLGTRTATVTIDDDDELTARVANLDTTVVEGDPATFVVTLMSGTDIGTGSQNVAIDYTVTGADTNGAQSEDFTPQDGTLTIRAGQSTGTIVVRTVDDEVLEPAESFQVTLTGTSPAVLFADDPTPTPGNSASTTIGASGRTVTASMARTTVAVTEGSKALFPVTLSGKVSENVTVTYSVAGSGADPATTTGNLADLTSAATSLVIEAGETSDTITVSTNEDNLAENSETFTVTLTDATGVSLGAAQATGTIRDNERLLVTLEGPDRVAQGGNADGYQVRLTGGEGSVPITVKYTIDGEAQTDISITSGTVASIPAITTGTDPRLEGHTLVVRLTEVSTAAGEVSLGSTREKRTEIVHQDTVTVSIAAATATVEEDVAAGTATFNVTSTGSPSGTVTVRYQTVAGSARSPADFTAGSGTATVGVPITVPIVDDTIAEGAETFSVRLTGQPVSTVDTDRVVLGTRTATVTIDDDDELTARVANLDTTVVEGDPATFVVTLMSGTDIGTGSQNVAIDYTVTGADTNGAQSEDFTPQDGTLTIRAGQSTGTIVVRTVDDEVLEPAESFQVTLTGTSPAVLFADDPTPTPGNSASTTIGASDGPFTVGVDDTTVDEGETAIFTVTLTGQVSANVLVGYQRATPDGGTASEDDFDTDDVSGNLTFSPGELTKTIAVQTTPDTLAENSETIRVQLTPTGLPTGVTLAKSTATATITDDALTVSVTGPSSVNEGAAAEYTVRLNGTLQADESVIVRYTHDTGTASTADYTAPSGTLTIAHPATDGTITVQTQPDDVVDLHETVVIELTGARTSDSEDDEDDVRVGTPSKATTTIFDSGTVEISVDDPEIVAEGDAVTFTVTLSGTVASDLTLRYETANGTATAGDYTAAPADATVVIPAGQMTATFTVATNVDNLDESPDETFTVTLTEDPSNRLPERVSIERATATATITDYRLTASVQSDQQTVREGADATFTVTLAGGTGRAPVMIEYTVGGSVTAADYTAPSGMLTIAAGATTGTITIATLTDNVLDQDETLTVTLTDADTTAGLAEVGSPAQATTTIHDPSTVSASVAQTGSAEEGEPVTLTVTLTGEVSVPVSIAYATADVTATEGVDYTASSGTVEVPANDTTATITVATDDDLLVEAEETFTVTLTADPNAPPPTGVTLTASAPATISDNDALTANITSTAQMVDEGATATFTVTLVGSSPGVVSSTGVLVEYQVGGTATAAEDYDPPNGTLTIPAGIDSGTIAIPILDDGVLDRGETLSLTLTRATTTGTVSLGTATASTDINDDTEVDLAVAAEPVTEGEAAMFPVTLSLPVAEPVTVAYATADGTAVAGSDYTAVSATMTFAAGQTSATLSVDTLDDTLPEVSETFTVTLSEISSAEWPDGLMLETATAIATISDNDPLTATVEAMPTTEGDAATLTVTLSHRVAWPVTVNYMTADGEAIVGEDYTAAEANAHVIIPAGEITETFTVATIEDDRAEGPETFTVTVTLELPPGVDLLTEGATATVTIVDDDELTVSVTGPKTVREGDAATYTVSLNGGTGSTPVGVAYSTADSTATAGEDFTAPSGQLIIAPGDTRGTVTIKTLADKELDPHETVVVKLTAVATLAGTVTLGSPRTATTTIVDPIYESINRVNRALLPGVARAGAASTLDALSRRMELGAPSGAPMAQADLAGLTGLYRALQANERALQDGTYDLAKVLGGSSFLLPLSSHDEMDDAGISFAAWGSGDFRGISGGDPDANDDIDWSGSAWSARLGADMRFIDSLLTGLAVSWTGSALDYDDEIGGAKRSGTYGSTLISVHPYVGWTAPDFGVWAGGGIGWGEVQIHDSEVDAQASGLTQWSLGAGANYSVLSTDLLIDGGTTALKLRGDGFIAAATVAENEERTIDELTVNVNQVRASVEASHAQRFAGGGVLTPTLDVGARIDGGDGDVGFGMEVGGGLIYADSGITVEGRGRALLFRDHYGEWGLSGLFQYDPGTAGQGLMVSVRPAFGATASGVAGLWEHGTLDLLTGAGQPGGRVEAEVGYGLSVFGATGVLTPYAGATLTDAGTRSISLGGRLQLAPAFEVSLEALRQQSDLESAPEHGITLEGTITW